MGRPFLRFRRAPRRGRLARWSHNVGLRRMTIGYDDFAKLDIRVGTIIAVDPFPEARKPAYKLTVDFGGDIGTRRSSAQITALYPAESLIGRQILAVVNFPPKRIGPFTSEVLCLGVPDADGAVVLVGPDRAVPNGGQLY